VKRRWASRAVAVRWARLRDADEGVTAMEFGLIAGAVVVTISTFLPGMSVRLSAMFSAVSNSL